MTLIDRASTWDLDARMQVVRLLAEFPEVRVNGPKRVLYDPSRLRNSTNPAR